MSLTFDCYQGALLVHINTTFLPNNKNDQKKLQHTNNKPIKNKRN